MTVSPFRIKSGCVISDGSSAVATLAGSAVTLTPKLLVASGSSSAPGIAFSSSSGTGFFSAAASTLGISVGGVVAASAASSGAWAVAGALTTTGADFTLNTGTADGADNRYIGLCGGGGTGIDVSRGAWYAVYGNEATTYGGKHRWSCGNAVTGTTEAYRFEGSSGNVLLSGTAAGSWAIGTTGSANIYYGTLEGISSNGGGNFFSSKDGSANRWSFGANNGTAFVVYQVSTPGTGGVYIDSGNTSWTARSDVRAKRNVSDIPFGLDTIRRLRPVSFHYNEDSEGRELRVGFIAQEVMPVLPQAVSKPENPDEMWGVSATELIPVLTKALQDLDAALQAEKARNDALEARLAALEAKSSTP